jgi:cell shape-determining protein mreB
MDTFLADNIVNSAMSKTLTPHEIKIGTENDTPKISITFGVASMNLISPPFHQIKNLTTSPYIEAFAQYGDYCQILGNSLSQKR